jgi:hypothetical protein
MEQLGQVHESIYRTDAGESHIKTVYLHNVRLTLEDNTVVILPQVDLNYYNYKSKKYPTKQLVLTQVTLWDKSTLPANSQFVIKAINDIPFTLWASTNHKSVMTARDTKPSN